MRCPFCGCDRLVRDLKTGELVCTCCGTVIEEEPIDTSGGSFRLLHQFHVEERVLNRAERRAVSILKKLLNIDFTSAVQRFLRARAEVCKLAPECCTSLKNLCALWRALVMALVERGLDPKYEAVQKMLIEAGYKSARYLKFSTHLALISDMKKRKLKNRLMLIVTTLHEVLRSLNILLPPSAVAKIVETVQKVTRAKALHVLTAVTLYIIANSCGRALSSRSVAEKVYQKLSSYMNLPSLNNFRVVVNAYLSRLRKRGLLEELSSRAMVICRDYVREGEEPAPSHNCVEDNYKCSEAVTSRE